MLAELVLLVIIVLLESGRWIYDLWWQRREERDLKEQTELLEGIAVTLSLKEVAGENWEGTTVPRSGPFA